MTRVLRFAVLALGLLIASVGPLPTHAQERDNTVPRASPNATVSQTIGVTEVTIRYGRPSVRGRDIFGGLVPFGKVWRTGANEATTITVSTPVRVEGTPLDAGTYSLFTIPGPDEWTLIFNETADQWGAYNYDSSNDALRVPVEPEPARARDMMTFEFRDVTDSTATALLHWSETRVPFDLSANTRQLIQSRAEEAVAKADSWKAPLPYVEYALEQDVLLEEAMTWVNRSLDMKRHYVNLRQKAYLLAKTGAYDEAVEAADAALSNAEGMNESPRGVEDLRSKRDQWASKQ